MLHNIYAKLFSVSFTAQMISFINQLGFLVGTSILQKDQAPVFIVTGFNDQMTKFIIYYSEHVI